MIFVDYAADIARRTAACSPARVLETAAGTGIVTRQLRDFLHPGVHLTATDLNAPMLEVARTKFRPGEQVAFQPADAAALPFSDGAFDAVVCQFGVMFFPQNDTSYREVHRVLAPGGHYLFSVWDSHRHNPFGRLAHETAASFFPADPPQFYMVPFSYYQIDPIKESLIDAGLTDISVAVIRSHPPPPCPPPPPRLPPGGAGRCTFGVAAFRRERLGDSKANPLARPGDERALPLQLQIQERVSCTMSCSLSVHDGAAVDGDRLARDQPAGVGHEPVDGAD